jgi:hypothetical protein
MASAVFDSETCEIMSRALDHALKQLNGSTPADHAGGQAVKAKLTDGIIKAVDTGERDEYRLAAAALSYFQQEST